jgi:hypothetical protein
VGRFIYENDTRLDIDDRVLLHLQSVIGAKLRRGEAFTFNWTVDRSLGSGRTTVWLHPHSSIVFSYSGSRRAQLNRKWLEALMFAANSPAGLYLVPEPVELPGERESDDESSVPV